MQARSALPPASTTSEQLETIKTDLGRFCPIAKVIRGAGTSIAEDWIAEDWIAEDWIAEDWIAEPL